MNGDEKAEKRKQNRGLKKETKKDGEKKTVTESRVRR
jgi:hypothetical protein